MEKVDIQILEYGSFEQKNSIVLRYKVLREPLGLQFTAEQLAAEHDEVHIAAFKNEKIVGILLLKIADEHTIKMRQVAIEESTQNLGIGKQLVVFAETYALQNGFMKIELHARATAIPFYLKLSYNIIGDEFEEVGIPHFKMKKEF